MKLTEEGKITKWLKSLGMEDSPLRAEIASEWADNLFTLEKKVREYTIEEILDLPQYTFQPVGGFSTMRHINVSDIEQKLSKESESNESNRS